MAAHGLSFLPWIPAAHGLICLLVAGQDGSENVSLEHLRNGVVKFLLYQFNGRSHFTSQ
jgi:hypothetical protein